MEGESGWVARLCPHKRVRQCDRRREEGQGVEQWVSLSAVFQCLLLIALINDVLLQRAN